MKKINISLFFYLFVLVSLFLLQPSAAYAQPGGLVIDDMPRAKYLPLMARKTKFKEMEHFGDVFHSNKFLLGQNRISGNISYNWGRVMLQDETGYHSVYRNALGFFTRIRFFEEFSLNTTFYKNFEKRADVRWIGDFGYAIGRFTWRPNKFNYGYENYINNKYSDSWDELGRKFMEGNYFLSYSHFLPEKMLDAIKIDSTTNFRINYFAKYAIRYRDENNIQHGDILHGKPVVGIGARYTVFWNIYIEGATYFYFNPSLQKQPWDPDYSYGFGYFDWRAFRASITYGNWAVNRFSWNKDQQKYPYYGFLDGQFRVSVNYIW
jgi:hypothetical protein